MTYRTVWLAAVRSKNIRYKKRYDTLVSYLFLYNGLPVCAMRERVNRYMFSYWNMLTLSTVYGKMFLHRKGCEEANI